MKMQVQVIRNTLNQLPRYETPESAGCDLRAELNLVNEKLLFNAKAVRTLENVVTELIIYPGGRALIPTGIKMALPVGFEAQVRPRSGLALKYGITVLNTPGTIDASPKTQIKINYIINF